MENTLFRWHAGSRFADDLKQADKSEVEPSIGIEIGTRCRASL